MQKPTARRITPKQPTPATAYHEAGHAVAAYFLGIPFRRNAATVVPNQDEGTAGCVSTRSILSGQQLDVNTSDVPRLRCERRAMFSLAGVIAQRKFNSRSMRSFHGHRDFHAAVDLMGYFFEEKVLDANLAFLTARIESLFSDDHPLGWRCVEAVAEALLKEKQLTNVQLTDVIEKVIGVHKPSARTCIPF